MGNLFCIGELLYFLLTYIQGKFLQINEVSCLGVGGLHRKPFSVSLDTMGNMKMMISLWRAQCFLQMLHMSCGSRCG